jgi:glutamate/aspartate transport system substrate-binding protein
LSGGTGNPPTSGAGIAANRFVSKVAANLRTLDDLKGKTVVSTIASTNLKKISELNARRHLGLTILAAKDNFDHTNSIRI